MVSTKQIVKGVLAELRLEEHKDRLRATSKGNQPTLAEATCECEHASHDWDNEVLTPHGKVGHPSYLQFYVDKLTHVKTEFGVFRVCERCSADCLASHAKPD
jgi:hypothetical protein